MGGRDGFWRKEVCVLHCYIPRDILFYEVFYFLFFSSHLLSILQRASSIFYLLLVQSVTLSGQAPQVSDEVYESFPCSFIGVSTAFMLREDLLFLKMGLL